MQHICSVYAPYMPRIWMWTYGDVVFGRVFSFGLFLLKLVFLQILFCIIARLFMGIIARQTIKGSIANYLGVAIGFVTTFFVLTDCLTAEEIGLTRILVDAAMLFSSLAMLGTSSSIVRFFPYFKEADGSDHGFFAWAMLLPLVGFVIFAVLFFVGHDTIVRIYSERSALFTNYVFWLLPLTFFALYMSVFEASANVLMRIAIPKFVREVFVRLCNLVSYLLYGHGIVSLDMFVVLFCSSYALAALVDFVYLMMLGKISFRIDRSFMTPALAKNILSYTLLVTVIGITSNVQIFNSLFIGAKGGLQLAGIYTIAAYIANVIGVPSRSLMAISGPVMAQTIKNNDTVALNRLVQNVSLHQLLVASLLYFFILINLDALYSVIPHGAEYAGGISVVLILGLNNILAQAFSPVGTVLSFSRSYAYSLPFSLLMSATAIVLNLTLIPVMGVSGAAAASLGATLVYYAAMLTFVWVRLGVGVFSWRQMRVIGIMAVLVVMYLLWSWLLSPLVGHVLIDAVLRTVVLGVVALWLVLRFKVSDDVNKLIVKFVPLLRRWQR